MARFQLFARSGNPSPENTPATTWFVAFPLTVLALSSWSAAAAAECEAWAARLVSAQGQVEMQPPDQDNWQPVAAEQHFCPGDKVRTLQQSRASLQLPNQTYLSLDQRTTVVFSHVEEDKPSWIELLKGSLLARSRTPKPLDIHTPFVNAAIKGTEFLVTAGSGKGEVTVFEGEVEASNADGQVRVTGGQTASAGPDQAPRAQLTLHPEDTVQWALYFPPLLDPAALRNPALAEASRLYADGKLGEALEALQRVPEANRDIEYTALRVSLLLGVGRVDEVEPLLAAAARGKPAPATIDALRSVIALARNRKDEALQAADAALRSDTNSAAAWLARSYALQAAFDLPQALEAAERAAKLNPNNALIQARRANLLASLGRWKEASETAELAIRLDPRQSGPWIVKGFADLRAGDIALARASFREAAKLDPGDPMARVGLGLAAIRQGDLREGTADLEMAASLDPGNSLIRSYLGKAYYEQKRNTVAGKEFEQAEQFDPKDPTPWFYQAIMKQTENRPVEALRDLQKAIELNGNRAIYRSKLALDQDLASRSAALARIYNYLGFTPRALVEGWRSANVDPANFSAHRLLADSYAGLQGQEVARASELLQSQLLQPINSTPVQPHMAESRLLAPQFSGPAQMSFNEFNPAFSRNGFNFQGSGLVGNLGTYGDEAVHSGIWNNFSYNLGQFHYQTEGFRPNNNLNQDIYSAFAQALVLPDLSVQAEYRHRDLQHGDLLLNGRIDNYDPTFRRNLTTDMARTGAHYSLGTNSDLIASLIYFDSTVHAYQDGNVQTSQRGFLGEAQHIYKHRYVDLISGVGQQSLSARLAATGDPTLNYNMDLTNGYVYSHVHYPQNLTWILGTSVDAATNRYVGSRNQVNPKLGMQWEITPDTLLRMAAFRTYVRGIEVASTIEPTQIAGFSQFFDGWAGSDSTRYGIGLDQRFSPGLLMGIEASRRDLKRASALEAALDTQTYIAHQNQTLVRTYADWAISDSFAAHLEYLYDYFKIGDLAIYKNNIVPVGLNYFHPSGFGMGGTFTYVNQSGLNDPIENDSYSFGLVDLAVRYRLPRRHGMAILMVKNLLDHKFDFIGQNTGGYQYGRLEEIPLFIPDRTISLQLTLAF